MLTLFSDQYYSRIEAIVTTVANKFVDEHWPVLNVLLNYRPPTEKVTPAASRSVDHRQTVITTRRGVRVVVNNDEVCFYGSGDMIRADWMQVPGIIASLRSAVVPLPKSKSVSAAQAAAGLELASGFGGGKEELLFDVGDAEDIVSHHRDLINRCPDPMIAGEINHVRRVGPKKLFRYIEQELLTE